jgi:hypothetical protein
MANRLLDRQVSLISYLTSGAAIFGDDNAPLADPALQGFDPRLLRLEARFSHQKRMEKIAGVFSRTLDLLGTERAQVVQAFAERCPSVDIGRIENARQFHTFLSGVWRFRPPGRPYLPDLAACELAFAEVRNWVGDASAGETPKEGRAGARPRSIRRHPGIALQRCDHDVRPLFEADDIHSTPHSTPVKRETLLAFATPRDAADAQVFELDPAIFGLLSALNDWTERSAFGATEDANALIDELASHGLVETGG